MPNKFDKELELKEPKIIPEDLRLAVAFFGNTSIIYLQ